MLSDFCSLSSGSDRDQIYPPLCKKKKKDYIKNNVFQETMYQVVRNDPQLGDPTVSRVGCLESYKAETWEGKSMWKPHDFLNQDVAERLGRT